MRYWTEEEKKYLAEITPGRGYQEITEMMIIKFNQEYKKTQVGAAIKRYGLKTGRTGRFEKGHVPFNKGTKGLTGANKTSFKKAVGKWMHLEQIFFFFCLQTCKFITV